MTARPPESLPDPWLFDSEKLLRELEHCRTLVNSISIENAHATHFGINTASIAIFELERTLRYCLHLHREGQRAFARQHREKEQTDQKKAKRKKRSTIIALRA